MLITVGALLGKIGPTQQLVLAVVESTLCPLNVWIGEVQLGALDAGIVTLSFELVTFYFAFDYVSPGRSMLVHTFGAVFGVAAAKAIYRGAQKDNSNNCSVYHSDM